MVRNVGSENEYAHALAFADTLEATLEQNIPGLAKDQPMESMEVEEGGETVEQMQVEGERRRVKGKGKGKHVRRETLAEKREKRRKRVG